MSRKLFGTDGVRGTANTHPMTAEMALRLGAAAGRYFRRDSGSPVHRVVIGKDTRLSGYMLENALTAGLTSTGMNVLLLKNKIIKQQIPANLGNPLFLEHLRPAMKYRGHRFTGPLGDTWVANGRITTTDNNQIISPPGKNGTISKILRQHVHRRGRGNDFHIAGRLERFLPISAENDLLFPIQCLHDQPHLHPGQPIVGQQLANLTCQQRRFARPGNRRQHHPQKKPDNKSSYHNTIHHVISLPALKTWFFLTPCIIFQLCSRFLPREAPLR